jgi:hypothetical protein
LVNSLKIIENASSSDPHVRSLVNQLSDRFLTELAKARLGTFQLPSLAQRILRDISNELLTVFAELSSINDSNASLDEKIAKVKEAVQQKIRPLLDTTASRVQDILMVISSRGQEAKETA